VEEARAITGPQWLRAGGQRIALTLGPGLFAQVTAAGRLCDDLAEVCRGLDRFSAAGDRALTRVLTPRTLELLHHPGITRLVARNFAAQTVPAASDSAVALVNALRALGVWTCVRRGQELGRCRCLWPLACHDHARAVRNDVRMVVRFGLDRIPAAWMVVEPTG